MRHFLRDTAITLVTLAAFGVARSASAHFNLLNPPPADAEPLTQATGGGKGPPPCGSATKSGVVTAVTGGSMLDIHVQETVIHSGHYRFALAASPDTLPVDPDVQVVNGDSVNFDGDPNAAPPVIMDGVWSHTSGQAPMDWTQDVRVPNINCDNCTLQVIEFMADHLYNGQPPANGNPATGGGYYYHHCAALKITADTTQALDTWPTVDADGAGQTGANGGAGGAPSESGGASGAATGGSAQTGAAGTATMTVSASGTAGAAATSTATGAGGSASVSVTAGSSAGSAGSAASASAGASGSSTDTDGNDDGGGCNLGTRSTGSVGAFGALLALGLGLGARRRR